VDEREKPGRLVTCSCGWELEWLDAWAAKASARLDTQLVTDRTGDHAMTITGPRPDPPTGQQLQLP
jgi:hypothetical protein